MKTIIPCIAILLLAGCTHVGSFTPTELNTLHELSYQHCKDFNGAKYVSVYSQIGGKDVYNAPITTVIIHCNNGVVIQTRYPRSPE